MTPFDLLTISFLPVMFDICSINVKYDKTAAFC